MEAKIPVAREETSRRQVLLAGRRTRASRKDSPRGDPRSPGVSNVKGKKSSTSGVTAKKGKSDAETPGTDGRRGRKRGRNYSLGECIRKAERRDSPFGRSAQELGIEWPDDRCERSPVTKAHHFCQRSIVSEGFLFECKYCHSLKWIPTNSNEARKLGNYLKIYGKNLGYQKMLDKHPKAKRLISKIQDIQYLRRAVSAEHFPIAVASIVMDKEYPYDVEIREEDIL